MTAATKSSAPGPPSTWRWPRPPPRSAPGSRPSSATPLARVDTDFDLSPIERVLDRWWGIAAIRANPLSDAEREQLARARAGDDTGWIVHHKDGTRTRL